MALGAYNSTMQELSKKEVARLAGLARLALTDEEEKKLSGELGKILAHFGELNEVNTDNTRPLSGGTDTYNSFREDIAERTSDTGQGTDQFPESRDGYLDVPKIL